MIILIGKIIENGLKKNINFTIETYLEDIFETDTNNLNFPSIDNYIGLDDKFIFSVDLIVLNWIKETLSIENYFSLYNKLNTLEKIRFVNVNLDSIIYGHELAFLEYVVKHEMDQSIRNAVAQEIKKMESSNEGIIEEFKVYLDQLEDINYLLNLPKEVEEM